MDRVGRGESLAAQQNSLLIKLFLWQIILGLPVLPVWPGGEMLWFLILPMEHDKGTNKTRTSRIMARSGHEEASGCVSGFEDGQLCHGVAGESGVGKRSCGLWAGPTSGTFQGRGHRCKIARRLLHQGYFCGSLMKFCVKWSFQQRFQTAHDNPFFLHF